MLALLPDLLALKVFSGLFILKSVPCPTPNALVSETSFPKETLDALKLVKVDFPVPTKFNPLLVLALFPTTDELSPFVVTELLSKESNATMDPSTTTTLLPMPAVLTVWLLDAVIMLLTLENSVMETPTVLHLARSSNECKLSPCLRTLCGPTQTRPSGILGELVLEICNHPSVFLLLVLMLVP
jgi:hypothetical protein